MGTQRLRYFGAAFELSCSILAALMRVVRTAVIGVAGWARLLWLLVRSYQDIRPLYKELQALPVPEPLRRGRGNTQREQSGLSSGQS